MYNCEGFACFHHRMEDVKHVYIQADSSLSLLHCVCVCVCVCVCPALWVLSEPRYPHTVPMVRSFCHPTVWHRCSLFSCLLCCRMFSCVLELSARALTFVGREAETTWHILPAKELLKTNNLYWSEKELQDTAHCERIQKTFDMNELIHCMNVLCCTFYVSTLHVRMYFHNFFYWYYCLPFWSKLKTR